MCARRWPREASQCAGWCDGRAHGCPAALCSALAGGLDDIGALRDALRGAEGVMHLAARVHVPSDRGGEAAFHAVNVEGTRTLLSEAIAAGVRAFVFVSSVKAVGERSEEPWDETTPPAPLDAYGRSKLEAETIIRSLAQRHADPRTDPPPPAGVRAGHEGQRAAAVPAGGSAAGRCRSARCGIDAVSCLRETWSRPCWRRWRVLRAVIPSS